MKKKIIFMVINMNIGGTEKALLNMIAEMPKKKYDITILMLEKFGGFLDAIPSHVHVEYVKGYREIKGMINDPPRKTILDFVRKGNLLKAFYMFLLYSLSKVTQDRNLFFSYLLRDLPNLDHEYDIAVAYAGPMDFISYFVIHKIKAERKIQWIHFDITKIGFNRHFAAKLYHKFDKIFVVSNEGRKKFILALPALINKTDTFVNQISPQLIWRMSDEGPGFTDNYDGIRILTVGRLSKEKGQDITIRVLAQLKQDGYNVRWYCVGDGGLRTEYEQLIRQCGVEEDYILLGSNPNPYPFMKQCDLYVQPSRHEGYCITLAEAKCFDHPIISTDFTGAREQISNEHTGLIIDFDEQQMVEAIKWLQDDKVLRNRIEKNLQKSNEESQQGKSTDIIMSQPEGGYL